MEDFVMILLTPATAMNVDLVPLSPSTAGPMVDVDTKVLIARTLALVINVKLPLLTRREAVPSTATKHDRLRQKMRIMVG
jgi:hypothetical protein